MRKIIERLLVFIIGIPAVYALVFLFPQYNHLALNITVVIFSAIGALEFSFMLEKKNIKVPKFEAVILGSLAPLAALIMVSLSKPGIIIGIIILSGILWALLSSIFTKKENMDGIINRFTGYISVMVYPGFFMLWLILMSRWDSSAAIFLFLLIVFFNDSAAWLFGNLFGKNNRGLIPVSPNKSIAGFIGGMIGSIAAVAIALHFFPNAFIGSIVLNSNLMIIGILLGFLTGIFASLGDLAESAIKRSCEFKDSGNMILGRGGILDSIDSIAVAAPVYYLLYNAFLCNIG